MARVHKSGLVKEVSSRTQLKKDICDAVIEQTIAVIADLLEDGHQVVLPNLGVLKTRTQAARTTTDFAGNKVIVPAHRRATFKVAKALKERLKNV